MGYARVVVNLRQLSEALSMRPELLGIRSAGEVATVMAALGAHLRQRSTPEACAIVLALVERGGQEPRTHVADLLEVPVVVEVREDPHHGLGRRGVRARARA